jgi:predicted nucleic acid-binding protein
MTFLDTSTIIDYMADDDEVLEYLDGREPFVTSTFCIFEVLNGRVGSGKTDVHAVRRDFDGVRAIDLNETIAIEAARLQDEILSDGDRLSPGDALVAATARSTGDEFVVADSDFQTAVLEEYVPVTNLRS